MLTVTIAGRDVTLIAEQYSFSNVARGGFEQAQFQLSFDHPVERGDEVIIFEGGDIAWHGFVNSPGEVGNNGKRRTGIVALGYGAKLKGATTRIIFVDADLNAWVPPGTQRSIDQINSNFQPIAGTVVTDPAAGYPAMKLTITGAWASPVKPISEMWYYAYDLNIESVHWAFYTPNLHTDATWAWGIFGSDKDSGASFPNVLASGNLHSQQQASGLTVSTDVSNTHAVLVQMYYNNTPAGTAGQDYNIYFTSLAVYGDHGLSKRQPLVHTDGMDVSYGFYPVDVARWAITNSPLDCTTFFDIDGSNYIIRDLKYKTPTEYEKIVSDAAVFLGWMWGTWEPASMFNTIPQFRMEAPPSQPTCEVSLFSCDDIDEPVASLDNSYNRAVVSYSEAGGTQRTVTIEIDNPVLDSIGDTRDLQLQMGIADEGAATTYGEFALSLAQSSQRGGGSVTLSSDVRLTAGGSKPATLLRSGRDRLRMPELNDGNLFLQDDRSLDAFLVERVETTVANGKVTTRVEFDSGADLMEVINARMTSELTAANVQR